MEGENENVREGGERQFGREGKVRGREVERERERERMEGRGRNIDSLGDREK